VTAFVEFVLSDPIDGTPCFEIGCAVPEAYRNQGRAKNAVVADISELKRGLMGNKISTFYVEAIVSADNNASQHVAAATITTTPSRRDGRILKASCLPIRSEDRKGRR
jgi:hypothetical protein